MPTTHERATAVMITGATGGLGQNLARRLARDHAYDTIVLAVRNAERGELLHGTVEYVSSKAAFGVPALRIPAKLLGALWIGALWIGALARIHQDLRMIAMSPGNTSGTIAALETFLIQHDRDAREGR